MELDIPTYFNDDFLNFIKKVNNSGGIEIKHVYGSVSGSFSARESRRLSQISKTEFEKHIEKLKDNNVNFFYALNTSCLGELTIHDAVSVKMRIKEYINLGVENFIIAHPFLIKEIREMIPNGKIKASVILEIDNIKTFEYYLKNVDIINISTRMNRNFRFLDSIKKYKNKLELLCNEVCLFNCPFRQSHYTIESHRGLDNKAYITKYPLQNCYSMMTNEELIMSRFILPEWLIQYSEYVDIFKISGRTFPEEFIKHVTKHYSKLKSPQNILELFPIVTGSIENEQSNKFEKRKLEMTDLEKLKFIDFFKFNGQNCDYNCPCGFCKSYTKNFER